MKKIYVSILLLFLSYSIHAQDDPDLLGTWYLHSVETNGSTLFPPSGSALSMVFINSTAPEPITGNSTCNGFSAGYVISNNNSSINVINFLQTLGMCNGDMFEPFHLGVLGNDATNFFNYTIDIPNGLLTMTDMLGEKLVYGRQVLSTEDNEILSNNIKIYPNPTKKELFIADFSIDSKTTYSIYNMVGNIVLSERTLTQEPLDVIALKAGIYFIKITQQGKTVVKKFVKI